MIAKFAFDYRRLGFTAETAYEWLRQNGVPQTRATWYVYGQTVGDVKRPVNVLKEHRELILKEAKIHHIPAHELFTMDILKGHLNCLKGIDEFNNNHFREMVRLGFIEVAKDGTCSVTELGKEYMGNLRLEYSSKPSDKVHFDSGAITACGLHGQDGVTDRSLVTCSRCLRALAKSDNV